MERQWACGCVFGPFVWVKCQTISQRWGWLEAEQQLTITFKVDWTRWSFSWWIDERRWWKEVSQCFLTSDIQNAAIEECKKPEKNLFLRSWNQQIFLFLFHTSTIKIAADNQLINPLIVAAPVRSLVAYMQRCKFMKPAGVTINMFLCKLIGLFCMWQHWFLD